MAARLTTYLVVAIVAVSVIAGLIVGAQRDDNEGPVDLIVHNAQVYTADGEGTLAEAVAIRGNQILRVGSNREINRLRRPQTTLIDAAGGTVVPGFNDANVRLVEGALQLRRVDLVDSATLEEVQARVATWAGANPDAHWILGRGWEPAMFTADQLTRQTLDNAVKDRPVALLSATGDALWVNSKALQLAGITRRTAAPDAGSIVKDARGEPTGLLQGTAAALVQTRVPPPAREARAAAVRTAVDEAHRLGITSVHDTAATPQDVELYNELRRSGDLDLRVYAALALQAPLDDGLVSRLGGIWKEFADDPLLKTGAVSIVVSDSEADEETATADALNRFVRLLDAQGWQVLADAQNARAVHMALNAYVHAARSNPAPARGRRHRIEGMVQVDAADVPRFALFGVVASVRPLTALPAAPSKRDARVLVGSGWPSAPLNPLLGLHAAIADRPRADTAAATTAARVRRMDLPQAVEAYTAAGAYASFDEQRKGAVTAGMLADLVVLSNDIFSIPAERLRTTTVAVTIFDGKVVYRRDAKSTN